MDPHSMIGPSGYYVPPTRDDADHKAVKRIDRIIATIRQSEDKLLDVVKEEMDKAARRLGIDRMDVLMTSHYYSNGEEIESRELAALEHLFCEVCSSGFHGLWTAEKGWYA